jgi:hypothetical protein
MRFMKTARIPASKRFSRIGLPQRICLEFLRAGP